MDSPLIKRLGLVAFEPTWRAMQTANKSRTHETPDEIWLLEHPPVFTLGLAGKPEHVLAPGEIEVIKIDRGGQVTYHGPGQLVVYLMLDLKRLGIGVKELVKRIEQSVIDLLAGYGIEGVRKSGMPGVYTLTTRTPSGHGSPESAKIAAVGLRVANHATYHGLSLNVDMDLEPFSRINPCGYEGLEVTQMRDCGAHFVNRDKMDPLAEIGDQLVAHLSQQLYGKHHG
ncbi:MAG: lipoyl(octanoyl) transferase LipB [Usitatibacteraceae bacterium]